MTATLRALVLNCTLKPSPEASSCEVLGRQITDFLGRLGADYTSIRVVDHVVSPGVTTDMGGADEWPTLREQVLAADIVVLLSPIWLGQHSSVAQRVLERLDAELSETDATGRPVLFDKVAVAAVLGNEDGAHHVVGIFYQALSDVGFTVPAQGCVYWNGEAMQHTDYKDLEQTPPKVAESISTALTNAVHVARLLKEQGYPAPS